MYIFKSRCYNNYPDAHVGTFARFGIGENVALCSKSDYSVRSGPSGSCGFQILAICCTPHLSSSVRFSLYGFEYVPFERVVE